MVSYHPAVQRDVSAILKHYDEISPQLGDAFWQELLTLIEQVEKSSHHFHYGLDELRRVNLKRFPYHILFRVVPDEIRVT